MNDVTAICPWKNSIFILLFFMIPFLHVYSQGNPTANNFQYPQSVFVDSQNGHVWVTDFSQHRIMRFDITGMTGIGRPLAGTMPEGYFLSQNYPNPFNPKTHIRFRVPSSGRATVSVSNVLGQQVRILFDGYAVAGTLYSLSFESQDLPSGMYLYALRTDAGYNFKKMSLVK
jgi:hypothetical protein